MILPGTLDGLSQTLPSQDVKKFSGRWKKLYNRLIMTRNKQKKIFLWSTAAFMVFILFVSYDIASRTTFPGSKGQLQDRVRKHFTVEEQGEGQNEERPAAENFELSQDSVPRLQ